jgi:queuine/archaeosine tRNA-ribosyltransferase
VNAEHHLSERDKAELAMHFDEMVKIAAERYNVSPHEIVETVRWAKERRASDDRAWNAARTAVIGIILSALMLAVWEGVKFLSRR